MTTLQGNGFDLWLSMQDAGTRALYLIDQVGMYAAYLQRQSKRKPPAIAKLPTQGDAK